MGATSLSHGSTLFYLASRMALARGGTVAQNGREGGKASDYIATRIARILTNFQRLRDGGCESVRGYGRCLSDEDGHGDLGPRGNDA